MFRSKRTRWRSPEWALEQRARHRAQASRKGLLGTTLRYPYELRDEDDYFHDIPSTRVSKGMIDLDEHLATKASKFNPDRFKDKYEALKALVKRKAAGKTIEVPEEVAEESNVIDLVDALKQSLCRRKPAKAAERANDSNTRGRKRKAA